MPRAWVARRTFQESDLQHPVGGNRISGTVGVAIELVYGLAVTGERQTVRGLTFEHMWQALWVGCCLELAGGENE